MGISGFKKSNQGGLSESQVNALIDTKLEDFTSSGGGGGGNLDDYVKVTRTCNNAPITQSGGVTSDLILHTHTLPLAAISTPSMSRVIARGVYSKALQLMSPMYFWVAVNGTKILTKMVNAGQPAGAFPFYLDADVRLFADNVNSAMTLKMQFEYGGNPVTLEYSNPNGSRPLDADTVITIGCNFTQGNLANSITAYMAEITTTFDS